MEIKLFVIVLVFSSVLCDYERMLSLFSQVDENVFNEPTTLESGTIPKWINGHFIRQSCGSYGEVNTPIDEKNNYVQHIFDCIEMINSWRIQNGTITFFNKYWDTVKTDIWNHYNKNMNQSRVWYPTLYSAFDADRVREWEKNYTNPNKLGDLFASVPWLVQRNGATCVIMTTEAVGGWLLDVGKFKAEGVFNWKDNNMGYNAQTEFLDSPSHYAYDRKGDLWAKTGVIEMKDENIGFVKHVIYKNNDGTREVIGEFSLPEFDLRNCKDNKPYPDLSTRYVYTHSFAVTDNFAIVPLNSCPLDTCQVKVYKRLENLWWKHEWEQSLGSRVLIMNKNNGEFVADIPYESSYFTHHLNAYEDDDGNIVSDVLIYKNNLVWSTYTRVENIINERKWESRVIRMKIDTQRWKIETTELMTGRSIEFTVINLNVMGQKYKYSYLHENIFMLNCSMIKLNVDTKEQTRWKCHDGFILGHAWFVPNPSSNQEDDGLLFVQGTDANRNGKGFLVMLDARTMKEVSHVTAPGRLPLGYHPRFIPMNIAEPTEETLKTCGKQ